jgi:hypothetical protein
MKYAIDIRWTSGSPNWGDFSPAWGLLAFFERKRYPRDSYFLLKAGDRAPRGEELITIILNNMALWQRGGKFYSDTPVFAATMLAQTIHGERARVAMKNYDLPILARDRRTVRYLKHYGYDTVLWGCSSLLLPKRDAGNQGEGVFGVDVPPQLFAHMPEAVKEQFTDLGSSEHEPDRTRSEPELFEYNLKYSRDRLDKIRDEARLVITSRLHVAAPCVAMGVPVILAINHLDERFTVLEPFIPLYAPADYGRIDWSPAAPDIEETKDRMCDIFEALLQEAQRRSERKREFSALSAPFADRYNAPHRYKPIVQANFGYYVYEARPFEKYSFFERIIGRKLETVDLLYYGCGDVGKHFFNSTYALIKQARSFAFVDGNPKFEGLSFEGYKVIKPGEIANYKRGEVVIIITANGFSGGVAHSIADYLSLTYGMVDGEDYFLHELLMITLTEYNFNDPYTLTTRMCSKVSATHDIFKALP